MRDRNNTNSTVIADALTIYFAAVSIGNESVPLNNTLTLTEVDNIIGNIIGTSFLSNSSSSYIIIQPVQQGNKLVLGASTAGNGMGDIVDTLNQESITNSTISTAAIISNESLAGVTYLSMLIINNPIQYRHIDNSANKTLVSSVIVVAVQRDPNITQQSMNISLFFQVLDEFKSNFTNIDYYCSFYDANNSQWNESGCTKPIYNSRWNRYECSCNHLTSFALVASSQTANVTTEPTSTTTTPSPSQFCVNATHTLLPNGTCVLTAAATV